MGRPIRDGHLGSLEDYKVFRIVSYCIGIESLYVHLFITYNA